jgi:hypothetical protein
LLPGLRQLRDAAHRDVPHLHDVRLLERWLLVSLIDLDAEYAAALRDTTAISLRSLYDAGATERGMALAAPALARLQLNGGGLFEPDPDGPAAFIMPVRVEFPETPESIDPLAAITSGDIVDLVAFTPALRARWALRCGAAEWLGACAPQYMEPEPVRLYRSPLDWLRASCEGMVCLATAPRDTYRFLTRFHALSVEDEEHATTLREIIDRPFFQPEILIGGRRNGR